MVFIDSLTTVDSKGEKSAKKYDVDYLKRTVFIDSPGNTDVIINRLKKAARVRREKRLRHCYRACGAGQEEKQLRRQ